MSGGVDSSVAAALLKARGFDVVGAFMRCMNIDGCAERDAEDARRVAEHLGIPFYVFDFEEDYRRHVVSYMIDGYRRGITPNPDVMCNKTIKFGLFLEKALALGADGIATGHYVRLTKSAGRPILKISRDANKDQSYFLWALTPKTLERCLFPIGNYTKPEVRRMARRWKLPTAEKKDSQGICFLGDISLREFLGAHIPEREGAIVTTDGKAVGVHRGAWFYTVGQRHIGTALRMDQRAAAEPWYVAKKDVRTNTLVVARGREHPALMRNRLLLKDPNLVSVPLRLGERRAVLARVRYRQPLGRALLSRTRHGHELVFRAPQKFVAPGQSAVLYSSSGLMLGGGVIA